MSLQIYVYDKTNSSETFLIIYFKLPYLGFRINILLWIKTVQLYGLLCHGYTILKAPSQISRGNISNHAFMAQNLNCFLTILAAQIIHIGTDTKPINLIFFFFILYKTYANNFSFEKDSVLQKSKVLSFRLWALCCFG